MPKLAKEDPQPLETEEEDDDAWTIKKLWALSATDGRVPSPIDVNVSRTIQLFAPCLNWHNYDDLPKKIKITNTGHTLIVSAKWFKERPYLTDGCLNGKYVFSQIHFHWGKTPLEGSAHSVEGARYPLEMHIIHYKSTYITQLEALKHDDGLVTLVYFFELRPKHSPAIYRILSNLRDVRLCDTAVAIEPFQITELMVPFQTDYYVYYGATEAEDCSVAMMWMITRETGHISVEQLALFHLLLDSRMRPIYRNFGEVFPDNDRNVFHITPKYKCTNSTLSPVPLHTDVRGCSDLFEKYFELVEERNDN